MCILWFVLLLLHLLHKLSFSLYVILLDNLSVTHSSLITYASVRANVWGSLTTFLKV